MGISIAPSGGGTDLGAASASSSIGTALLSQVEASQTANVEALFSSLGVGTNTNTAA